VNIKTAASFLALILISSPAAAQEPRPEKKDGKFHFITFNCKESEREEQTIEGTPQSPPMDIDDPGTPGCNSWEVNVTFSGDMTKHEKEFEDPLLDINYGVGDNLQLKYEIPYAIKKDEEAEEREKTGVGNSKFGIKWQFMENEESGLDMALYPQVEFKNPGSNSVDRELAEKGTLISLPLLVTKKAGKIGGKEVILLGNLGYNRVTGSDAPDSLKIGIGAGIPLFNKLAVMCDLIGEQSFTDNPETEKRDKLLKTEIGFMRPIGKTLLAYGSVGRSLYSSDDTVHLYGLLGLRAMF